MNDFVRLGHFKVKALYLTSCNIRNIGADGDWWTTCDMGNYGHKKNAVIATGMSLDLYGEGEDMEGIADIY